MNAGGGRATKDERRRTDDGGVGGRWQVKGQDARAKVKGSRIKVKGCGIIRSNSSGIGYQKTIKKSFVSFVIKNF